MEPEARFRGVHWMEKKRDPLGSCNHWRDMWKMAARRATLEVLGWAFVSGIRVFLILLDFPLLPRPLKTASGGRGGWIRGSSVRQSSPSLWGWLCQALRGHNALVKVWWIAEPSQRAIWVPIEKSSTQGKHSANYASLHQSYLDGSPMGAWTMSSLVYCTMLRKHLALNKYQSGAGFLSPSASHWADLREEFPLKCLVPMFLINKAKAQRKMKHLHSSETCWSP